MNRLMPLKIAALLFVSNAVADAAKAVELKALFPAAMKNALTELVPQFEKSSGHKVTIDYGTVGAIVDRLKKGEAADLAVVTDVRLADLTKQDKIMADGQAVIAVVGIGVFVRKGEAKPDIGSVEAFKKALLSAKSIVYGDPALGDSSGIYVSGLIERLGIAAEMKPKAKLVAAGSKVDTVAKGDAEIGFDQMSNVVVDARVESVGSLPSAIQNYTKYAGGIVAGSKQQEAVKTLIVFLTSSASQSVMKQKGFEGF